MMSEARLDNEIEWVRAVLDWAGGGRRANTAWYDALLDVQRHRDAMLADPTDDRHALRLDAAKREAERIATAATWQVIADYLRNLPDVVGRACDAEFDSRESLRRWVCLRCWVHNTDKVELQPKDGDLLTLRPDRVSVDAYRRTIDYDFESIFVAVRWDDIASWEAPTAPAPNDRDLALIGGHLSREALLALAESEHPEDRVAAVCSPDADADVWRAAGATLDVWRDHRGRTTVEVIVDGTSIRVGEWDDDPDDLSERAPAKLVVGWLDDEDLVTLALTVHDWAIATIPLVCDDDIDAMEAAASVILERAGLTVPRWEPMARGWAAVVGAVIDHPDSINELAAAVKEAASNLVA